MLQPSCKIELVINGREALSSASTMAELIHEQDLAGSKIATALNGRFVPESGRATTVLNTGDRVEIVSARQGG